MKDCTWLTPAGAEMTSPQWHDPAAKCLGLLLAGRAQTNGIRRRGGEATLLVVTNAHHGIVEFTLPKAPAAATGFASSTPTYPTMTRTMTRAPSSSGTAIK